MMKRLFLFSALMLAIPFGAKAAYIWEPAGTLLRLQCGSYCDIAAHRGRLVAADSNNGRYPTGDVWISQSMSVTSKFNAPFKAIARRSLRGFQDEQGQEMDYVRTSAIASEGSKLHALFFVGATYGSSKGYNYRPAYAVSYDRGSTWRYHGPVSVDGREAPFVRSSSMAYVVKNDVHFMVIDGGAYGKGRLVAFRSDDGRNWEQFGDDISAFADDRPVFPDLTFHNGRFHLVYENGWNKGGIAVRHLSSANMRNWHLESENIAPSNAKSVNIFDYEGKLYGHVKGRLWQAKQLIDKPMPQPTPNTETPVKSEPDPVEKPAPIADPKPVVEPAPIAKPAPDVEPGPVASVPAKSPSDLKKPANPITSDPFANTGPVYRNPQLSEIGETELMPKAEVSDRNVTLSWNAQPGVRYGVKLVGPTARFTTIKGDRAIFTNLKPGNYKARVRPKGGTYSDLNFSIR